MVTADEVRNFVLSLPEVQEQEHRGKLLIQGWHLVSPKKVIAQFKEH